MRINEKKETDMEHISQIIARKYGGFAEKHTLEEPIDTFLKCQFCFLDHEQEGRCDEAKKEDRELAKLDYNLENDV